MLFRKLVSIVLVFTQISFASLAFGDTSQDSGSASPEAVLLQNVIALQGMKLSQQQMDTQVGQAVSTYIATAPETGQQERFQQALVSLGIYTPAQATAFVTDAQASANRVAANADQINSVDQLSSAMQSEVTTLAQLHPTGAQFSFCDMTTGAVLAMGGIFTMIAGSVVYAYNPTCTLPEQSPIPTQGCVYPGVHPHATLGYTLMAVGGVAFGIGAIAAFLGVDGC
jgi:hypothetical protein